MHPHATLVIVVVSTVVNQGITSVIAPSPSRSSPTHRIKVQGEGLILQTREGGSEWEPIKILLGGDGDSNKTNTTSNTRLRLTTQVGQSHAATKVVLDLGTNKQPSEPKHTNTHNGNLHGLLPVLHRSDRWLEPVRPVTSVKPVDSAGQAGGYSSRTTSVPESLSDFSRP
jgi:hypothetical protein